MNKRVLRFGVIVGVIGGTVMAAWLMVMSTILGDGLFTPVNIIAHTFWKSAPLGGDFNLGALLLGTLIHLIIACTIGTILSWMVERNAFNGGTIVTLGIGIAAVAWIVQAFAWPAVDEQAAATKVAWAFAMGHMIFGVGIALILNWLRDVRHAGRLAGAAVEEPVFAGRPSEVRIPRFGNMR